MQSRGHQAQTPACQLESDSDFQQPTPIRILITDPIPIHITDTHIRIGTGQAFIGIKAAEYISRGPSMARDSAIGIDNQERRCKTGGRKRSPVYFLDELELPGDALDEVDVEGDGSVNSFFKRSCISGSCC